MKKTFLLPLLLIQLIAHAAYYKPLANGKWPFYGDGYKFTPTEVNNWSYATAAIPEGYSIYFMYNRDSMLAGNRLEGGVQTEAVKESFANADQFIQYVNTVQNHYNTVQLTQTGNTVVIDRTFGLTCVRYTRTFNVNNGNSSSEFTEGLTDEGFYFISPQNKHQLFRVHLFHQGPGADHDSTLASRMIAFYRLLIIESAGVPKYAVGGGWQTIVGSMNGLSFGYIDPKTGQDITIDPISGTGLSLSAYAQLHRNFVGGVDIGYSRTASPFSAYYSNIRGIVRKGTMIGVRAGVVLRSDHRNRFMVVAGPEYHSAPYVKIEVTDSTGGTLEFHYKPSLGGYFDVRYMHVNRKQTGQFYWGVQFYFMYYTLNDFVLNGQRHVPNDLSASFSGFRDLNGRATGVVVFGYQFFVH